MALSNDLILQFVKATQDKEPTKKESTAYGKIVKEGDTEYVQLDGSDLLTPISSTTVVKDGDRVMVTIKNHTATVTGDLTTPSASNKDVQEISTKISEFEIVIADKVSTNQLEAEIARIEKLRADDLEATNAKIETIEGKVAKIDTIEADVVEVNKKLTAHEGEFATIRADIADFKDITANSIDAIEGNFNALSSDYADFKELTTNKIEANEGDFNTLNSDYSNFKKTTTNSIDAIEGNFDTLNSDYANFKQTTTDNLSATNAAITNLETNKLDATQANIKYATIDFSNIGEAAVRKLFTESGIIKDLIMSDGKVTGELVGVTIKGDLIEGNTVKADKLVIQGEDGLYYKLNVNALGETTASSDQKYQNGLDGSVIVANSITAEKIAVNDLVAFGATIGGFHINDHALYSGLKNSIDNTLQGIFLGDDGQINVGDSNNYLKYFLDEDGQYKLEIQANEIKFGSDGTTIEEAIRNESNEIRQEVQTNMTSIEQNQNEILMTALKDYVATSDYETFKETISTIITQTNEDVTFSFNSLQQIISTMDENIQSQFREQSKYIRFDGGISMGETGNEVTLRMENDIIKFVVSNVSVLEITPDGIVAPKIKTNEVEFTPFRLYVETDGSLTLDMVGDN